MGGLLPHIDPRCSVVVTPVHPLLSIDLYEQHALDQKVNFTGLYLLKYNSIQTALYTFSNTAEAEVGKELLAKSATTLVSQQHAELSKSSFVFIPRSLPKEPRLFHYRAGPTKTQAVEEKYPKDASEAQTSNRQPPPSPIHNPVPHTPKNYVPKHAQAEALPPLPQPPLNPLKRQLPSANIPDANIPKRQKMLPAVITIQGAGYHYEILPKSEIGRGSFGIVNRALCKITGKMVALKFTINAGWTSSLKNEVRILRRIRAMGGHRSCIPLVNDFVYNGHVYMATTLCDGTLHDCIYTPHKRQVLMHVFPSIVRQLVGGLVFLKSRHIVHRDLKPGNIVVRLLPGGRIDAVFIDFGLAIHSNEAQSPTARIDVGTRVFSGPEVFNGLFNNQTSDTFSVGCSIIEVWTGRLAFPCDGVGREFSITQAHINWNLSLTTECNMYTQKFWDLALRMAHPDPNMRLPAEQAAMHPFLT